MLRVGNNLAGRNRTRRQERSNRSGRRVRQLSARQPDSPLEQLMMTMMPPQPQPRPMSAIMVITRQRCEPASQPVMIMLCNTSRSPLPTANSSCLGVSFSCELCESPTSGSRSGGGSNSRSAALLSIHYY